ncbi:MAG: DUF1934 domain-containing protein [Lachnospiraceae bacterium]|nr:DUF1934 domain-containing protein [Lachnospiraceae bacterium]
MRGDVLVSVRGLQMDDSMEADPIEIITSGKYTKKDNKSFLRFEQFEDDTSVTKNILTFDEKSMELTRRGGSQLHMSFFKDEKTLTNYGTPFGNILVGVDTKKISVDESKDQVHVAVDYALEINYEHMADCKLTVDIRPRAKGAL